MRTPQKKLQILEAQKKKLENEIIKIRQQKNEELVIYLNAIPDIDLDIPTLIGGLLYLNQKATKDSTKKETWRKEGERFRRHINVTKALQSSPKAEEEKTTFK